MQRALCVILLSVALVATQASQAAAESAPSTAARVPVELAFATAISGASALVTIPVLLLSIYACKSSVCAAGGLTLTVGAFSLGAAGGVHLGNVVLDSDRHGRFAYTFLGGLAGTSIAATSLLTLDAFGVDVFRHEWLVLSVIATMSSLGATLVFELDSKPPRSSMPAPVMLQLGGSF